MSNRPSTAKSGKKSKEKSSVDKISSNSKGTSNETRKRVNDQRNNSTPQSPPKTGQDVVGYIQSVSPSKFSRRNTEYCNFKLQCKDHVVPGVCFAPSKRRILVERESTKMAVKLQRVNYSADGKTIFVNDMMQVAHPTASEYDFQYVVGSAPKSDLEFLSNNCMDMDLVDFVAKVIAKDASVQTVGSSQLRRAECVVADNSCAVKLVLWEKDIEKVTVGDVYTFTDVRARFESFAGNNAEKTMYLNTTKETNVVKEDGHPLANLVNASPEIVETLNFNNSMKIPAIHAIEELVRYKQCCDCKRKIAQESAKLAIKCDSCGHVVRNSSCPVNCYCKFSIENPDSASGDNLHFIVFQDRIEELIGSIAGVHDEDIYQKLLSLENFEITFNKKDNIVNSVSLE